MPVVPTTKVDLRTFTMTCMKQLAKVFEERINIMKTVSYSAEENLRIQLESQMHQSEMQKAIFKQELERMNLEIADLQKFERD